MRAYERFLKYVRIHTTSDANSNQHPSSRGQFDLAHLLVEELQNMGLEDAAIDEKCYVYASLPASPGHEGAPALGFIAHLDTADDACGENVRPQLFPNYHGQDLVLPSGRVLDVKRFPFLPRLKGETLITSDGSTLLGADDKAGIAEIITAVERICTEHMTHGRICIAFTPDEEIGEGADYFDISRFGADFAYTVDGGDVGELEYENFNACSAQVVIHGCNVHPGSAKGIMVNAQNVALEFHLSLPMAERPEHTEGYEGFYHLCEMQGTVAQAVLKYIIRDFECDVFQQRKQLFLHIAERLNAQYGAGTVEVQMADSYFNMRRKIEQHRHLIDNACLAINQAGLKPNILPIRGGTDGARLSYEGLPCPNLGTGGFNFHGESECITAERMDKSVEVLLHLIGLYAKVTD